jgi:hypothetical protein
MHLCLPRIWLLLEKEFNNFYNTFISSLTQYLKKYYNNENKKLEMEYGRSIL